MRCLNELWALYSARVPLCDTKFFKQINPFTETERDCAFRVTIVFTAEYDRVVKPQSLSNYWSNYNKERGSEKAFSECLGMSHDYPSVT